MQLLERHAPAPLAAPPGLRFVALAGARWRVVRGDGSVLGYLAREGDDYTALRMRGRDPRLVPVGVFRRPEDALASLR